MNKVCSWCGAVLYVGSPVERFVTHSICAKCVVKVERQVVEWERKKERAEASD